LRGPPGYRNFLEAVRDPGHEEYEAMLEWVGDSFDAEAFDLAAVNRVLVAPRHSLSIFRRGLQHWLLDQRDLDPAPAIRSHIRLR